MLLSVGAGVIQVLTLALNAVIPAAPPGGHRDLCIEMRKPQLPHTLMIRGPQKLTFPSTLERNS